MLLKILIFHFLANSKNNQNLPSTANYPSSERLHIIILAIYYLSGLSQKKKEKNDV